MNLFLSSTDGCPNTIYHDKNVGASKRQKHEGSRGNRQMQVDLIFKVAAIGILVAVLNQLLVRSGREEQAMMTTLAGLIVVMMILIQEISRMFALIKTTFGF